ncbi:MAG TPA: flagellin [Phycisphaerae bacterium]|nr:flagellin [Phycisphaerae bacterium]HOJ72752.1 flagellin [Phycisphaerae bacterium]HOM51821.1 flagellin [Phycisphaerae bacterium]HOQ84399.1 flagellin [Phycisphaerae bacterium]HPP26883.1 flagellin [Phycisphaerae bacterium]
MTRINNNVLAIQARHRLAANNFDLGIRLERLSTGLRINRGRDDPAGLIASETLRSEIRGISQAIDNSTRAMNVISTAEGALNEISALLLDIRALINHAANEGAISDEEIKADQLQIDSLIEAVDRIANTTQFGGEKLINGNFGYTLSGVNAAHIKDVTVFGARVPDNGSTNVVVEVTQSAQTATAILAIENLSDNVTVEIGGNWGTEVLALTSGSTAANIATAINRVANTTGVSATVSGTGANTRIILNSRGYGESQFLTIKPIEGSLDLHGGTTLTAGNLLKDEGRDAGVLINGQTAAVDGLLATVRSNGLDLKVDMTAAMGTALGTTSFDITGGGATFQIGPEVNANGQVSIGIPSVASTNLGNSTLGFLNTIRSVGSNSIVGGNYVNAERIVVEAINQVAVIRGRLGGLQRNQIETNINSQRIALENVQAAESAIRDADIATEVAAMTRAQILVQSTTSILGLANQMPQNALALLGG